MGLFSKFRRKVQEKDDKAVLKLSRSTRLKRDIAAVGNVVVAASALPTGGTRKEHRIVKQDLNRRGLQIPDRTKRDYIIPATVGVVTCALGAGADAVAGFAGGAVPPIADATHEIPIDQWLDRVGDEAVETTTNHMQVLADPGFAEGLVEHNWGTAYDLNGLEGHAQNGVEHFFNTGDTIMPGGPPLLSDRSADVAGQTLAAVVIGEAVGKGIEVAAPRRHAAKHGR
ncbi:hypothetical protein FRC11_005863 [Ceratobasidium sp. 423]|nr:hypothetical protein FRC11_005863 [Ceratobasidium sp. 423]